jgi:hypothetical protein
MVLKESKLRMRKREDERVSVVWTCVELLG